LASAIKRTFKNRKFELSDFYNTASKIDTELLEENFKKAMIVSSNPAFQECWKIVLNKMKELDQFNKKP
ncbi:MAG: hypothetical protein PHY93_19615, partial [Bacteriovorax sp.]|nr:hypothetical protein [Bacteriovorax sp.]